MNKQFAFLILTFSISTKTSAQEKPKKQDSLRSNLENMVSNQAKETFGAVTLSEEIQELAPEFCDNVINRLPEKTKKRLNFIIKSQSAGRFLGPVILHGPTGSGKSTLAQVILQRIGMPFILVSGSMIGNEFQNSGTSGVRRIGNYAIQKKMNLCINEIDSIIQIKGKKNEYQKEDETPKAFWELLDQLQKNKILLIGTSNDLTGIPPQLKKRLKKNVFEISYSDQSAVIKTLILAALADHGASMESEESIDELSKKFNKMSIRDILDILSLAIEHVQEENETNPVITKKNVYEAWQEIEKNEQSMPETRIDKKEIFNYTVQTIGAVAALTGICCSIYSARNGYLSLKLAQQIAAFTKENATAASKLAERVADFNEMNGNRTYELAIGNQILAIENLKHAKEVAELNADYQQKIFELQGLGICIGVIGLGMGGGCTIS